MVITLIISLISTFFYINMMFCEVYNGKYSHYTANENEVKNRAAIRFFLILIMGIFWGITIRFW